MASVRTFMRWLHTYYDKFIATVVMTSLVGVLVFLVVMLEQGYRLTADYTIRLQSFSPRYPEATSVDITGYSQAMARTMHVFTIPASNSIFVPENRIACPECQFPVPKTVLTEREPCPFCEWRAPPPPLDADYDMDDMWDSWETTEGLDPKDPDDGAEDPDADGFTNVEEFNARTRPLDAADRPIDRMLYVDQIVAYPFPFVFQTAMVNARGHRVFSINMNRRTHFKRLGDKLMGYTLVAYEPEVLQTVYKNGKPVQREASRLIVERDGCQVHLYPRMRSYRHGARLGFPGKVSPYSILPGQSIEVRGITYEIESIDPARKTTTIRGSGEQRWLITPQTQ